MLRSIAFAVSEKKLAIAAASFFATGLLGAALITRENMLPDRAKLPLPLNSLNTLSKSPILRVELARNASDLNQALTPGNLQSNLDHARAGNILDTFLFIPSYSLLLASVGLILARGDDRWRAMLVLVAVLAVPLAAVSDWTENSGITVVLDKLERHVPLSTADATRISTPSLIKWTTTALILLIYGAAAVRRLSRPDRLFAALAVAGVGLGGIVLYTPTRYLLERYSSHVLP